ncbi:MAG TPA: hypothetical protein VGW12_06320 [Pyrinomonadaceae bacterium]|nr:hypothetical protein [Pyrinomonadaceae bacterium]
MSTINVVGSGWKGARVAFVVVLLIATTAATLILLTVASRNSVGADREKAIRHLERIREKYSGIRSIHLTADVKIAIYGNDFRAGGGTYEFWAENDRYRIRSRTDKHIGLKTDFDVAYDGKRFYLLDPKQKVLSYQQKDVPRNTVALPNPLFLPVDYLSNNDDDCILCALRLSDFKTENARSSNRVKSLTVKSERRDSRLGGVVRELEMPGGKTNKQAFRLAVRTLETSEDQARPLQIDRIALDGKALGSISFSDFMPSALGDFPRNISIKAFDDNGALALQAEFTIKTLEINEAVGGNIFTINFDEADTVWDSDEKRFVKEKKAGAPHIQ